MSVSTMLRPNTMNVNSMSPLTRLRKLSLAFIALSMLVLTAHAERADRDKPLNIEADRAEMDDKTNTAKFFGNVLLTQGTLMLKANELEVKQDNGAFEIGIAYGEPAYFKQKREGYDDFIEGEAKRIEYETTTETLRMFQDAKLWRDGDKVEGNFIKYNSVTEIFEVEGSDKGSGGVNSGRVKATIQPKRKD
jgi:lipopolysaccharide export system protein LptA